MIFIINRYLPSYKTVILNIVYKDFIGFYNGINEEIYKGGLPPFVILFHSSS